MFIGCKTTNNTTTNQPVNQIQGEPVNLTPHYQSGGIGPVNIAASNFFFKGELRQSAGSLSLFDCFTATTIPIDSKNGIYSELFSKYQSMYVSPVFVELRGFISKNPSSANQLVASYLINMHESSCQPNQIITGNWISNSMGTSPDGILVEINPDYTFNLKINLPEKNLNISGIWSMLSNYSIFFSYQQVTQYFSHTGTFSQENDVIIIPTDKGAITLKKR